MIEINDACKSPTHTHSDRLQVSYSDWKQIEHLHVDSDVERVMFLSIGSSNHVVEENHFVLVQENNQAQTRLASRWHLCLSQPAAKADKRER
jgi:hypothetical protein